MHLITCVYTILSCNRTVVADPSAISRQSVADQLGSNWQPIGDRSSTGWRLYIERLFLIAESLQLFGDWSATDRRLVGDQSATENCVGIVCNRCTGRRLVANQSATSRQPVGDHQKPFYDWFGRREVSLAATKTSLLQNRPCNLLQPVADQSPTSLQPPCNLPETTRNIGRKEVADWLQGMCDRGFTWWFKSNQREIGNLNNRFIFEHINMLLLVCFHRDGNLSTFSNTIPGLSFK